MGVKIKSRAIYLILTLLVLLGDRWTKSLILSKFNLNDGTTVIDGLFNITYVQNTGVAFGIFNSISSPAKSMLLAVFTSVAVLAVIGYSLRNPVENRLLQGALSLILGGALGNLYDRLHYGFVIDFLEFYIGRYHWPTFNLADSAISTGVLLLALEILRYEAPARA
jgi:signal peptidase II